MYAERQQAAQDAITRRITEKFEGNLDGMLQQEHHKIALRKKLLEDKLGKVQLDPARIQQRVTGTMLDKWETVLSAGAGGAGKGSGGGGGGSGGGGASAA